jgi:tetratricopeptide (TPR) repeat protein
MIAIIIGMTKWNAKRKDHYGMCRYISERQVTAAQWIARNTPESSVIATHDIGAIAFYSRRRIVDMVGLVSPDMIPHIGDLKKLDEFIRSERATHVATLRNWFEVVNQNALFHTNEREPEIMEVFEYRPNRTHFAPQMVTSMNQAAAQYLTNGDTKQAMEILRQSYQIDSKSVRTVALIGIGFASIGDTVRAIRSLEEALTLQPNYVQAIVPLARLKTYQKKYTEALNMLEYAKQVDPTFGPAHEAYQLARVQQRDDSLAAIGKARRTITLPLN